MSDKERNFTCDLHCKRAVTPTCVQAEAHVPIHLKMTLTIKEAAEYSSIGINKIDALLKQPNCPFVLFVGTRKLVKRREFEEYIRHELVI
jgi:excisionase family DNA binding protein